MSEANPVDAHRAQILRQRCARQLNGKSVHNIVGALEMLVADTLLAMPGQTEAMALSGASAIASDIQNIIRERFASQGKGH